MTGIKCVCGIKNNTSFILKIRFCLHFQPVKVKRGFHQASRSTSSKSLKPQPLQSEWSSRSWTDTPRMMGRSRSFRVMIKMHHVVATLQNSSFLVPIVGSMGWMLWLNKRSFSHINLVSRRKSASPTWVLLLRRKRKVKKPQCYRLDLQFMDWSVCNIISLQFEGKTSFGMSVFNLSNAIMGSGILGLAFAMSNTGIILFLWVFRPHTLTKTQSPLLCMTSCVRVCLCVEVHAFSFVDRFLLNNNNRFLPLRVI